MQVPPPPQAAEKDATGTLIGPMRVAVAAAKLILLICQILSELVSKLTKYSGEPAGGAVVPSRSAGSTPPKLELS